MLDKIRRTSATIRATSAEVSALRQGLDELKILTAKSLVNQLKRDGIYPTIRDAEFKVFSQFGDDGIIQYLIHHCRNVEETFIEFGSSDYRECNTRFLLLNNNWRGLVIDAGTENIRKIKREELYWRHDLTAISAFITKDNINSLFTGNGFTGDIGLLSIDIDGNDYWIWEAIDSIKPTIVVCEYNSLFGAERAVTIPYDAAFDRSKSHFSYLYWGCSVKALALLAEKKNYSFVGCNSNGNNAYFVRNDRMGEIKKVSVSEGYARANFRESRDQQGNLSYLSGNARNEIIGDMVAFDVERQCEVSVREL